MAKRFYPLIIPQGRTLQKPFRRRYASGPNAGQVIDFTAHGVTMGALQVRDLSVPAGGVVLLNLTTANGGVVVAPYTDPHGEDWSGYIEVSASVTGGTDPWGLGQYQLVLYNPAGTWVKTVFSGPSILVPEVTEVAV